MLRHNSIVNMHMYMTIVAKVEKELAQLNEGGKRSRKDRAILIKSVKYYDSI